MARFQHDQKWNFLAGRNEFPGDLERDKAGKAVPAQEIRPVRLVRPDLVDKVIGEALDIRRVIEEWPYTEVDEESIRAEISVAGRAVPNPEEGSADVRITDRGCHVTETSLEINLDRSF
jgi:hypothetical protein